MASTPTARLSTGSARAGLAAACGGRAHYELAAGRTDKAESLLTTLEGSAGVGGLLPEQVWDGVDMPQRELRRGGPTGSAMPLVWAHSEHIKLLRSLRDGKVFDMPRARRGALHQREDRLVHQVMAFQQQDPFHAVRKGLARGVAGRRARALEHRWGATFNDSQTSQNAFGIHVADLPVAGLVPGGTVIFTFFWPDAGHWEGETFSVGVAARHIG